MTPTIRNLLLLVVGLAAALTLGWAVSRMMAADAPGVSGIPAIGGPFELVDTDGKAVTDRAFRGRLMLVFFGYTTCPDICPTTLQTITQALDVLGPDAAQVVPLFITIDPARDTPEHLKAYVAQFSKSIIGLTGNEQQISAVAKAYRAYFKRNGEGSAYLMDHSAIIYLMDGSGQYLTHFPPDATGDAIVQGVHKALKVTRGP